MTVAATSEFSAASGTKEPQHWLDQVTLEGEEKTALIEEVLKYVQGNYTDGPCNREDSPDEQTNALESAARKVENKVVIWLMHQQLFGDENKNTLPEFLKSGISLDLRDEDTGQTLFMTECSRPRGTSVREEENKAQRVIDTIIHKGARTNPRLQNFDGETVSTLAARNARVEMLEVLAFFKDGTLRNAKGESPLGLLLSAKYPSANFPIVNRCLFRLIQNHDFAGMPETGEESFEEISRTFQSLGRRDILDNKRALAIVYFNALGQFGDANNQYHREETAQLRAQLAAAAEEKLGRTEVPALLLPPSPQS
jgi:hypothetical protein